MKLILRILFVLALPLSVTGCSGDDDDGGGPDAPSITTISPASGIVSTVVTITGENFGDEQNESVVQVGSASLYAGITSWSDTEIVAVIPPEAYPGPRDIVVVVPDLGSNAVPFTVILPNAVYANNNVTPTSVTAFVTSAGQFSGTAFVVGTGGSSGYGGDSRAITVHVPSRRVFSAHAGDIAVYDIDPVTGLLTAVTGSPFATGASRLFGIEVNAAGDTVYAADCGADDAVVAMAISFSGALLHLTGSPHVYAGSTNCIDAVRLTADESLLVASVEDGTVRTYSVAAADGHLTEVAGSPFSFPGAGSNYGFDMHPTLDVYYFASQNDGALYAWSITPGTGVPMLVGSAGIGQPQLSSFAFSESGDRLFTNPSGSDQLYVFDLDAAGDMTLNASSPFTLAGPTNALLFSAGVLYGGGANGLLYGHSVSGTGAPTSLGAGLANPGAVGGQINALASPY